MATAFLTLSDAVLAMLQQAPALAGGNIRRGRRIPVPENVDQAIDVHVERSAGQMTDLDGSGLAWDTGIAIDLYARAADGTDAEQAIDTLLAAVAERIAAATPPNDVMSWLLDPSIQWELDEADDTLVQASLLLRVQHLTDAEFAPA